MAVLKNAKCEKYVQNRILGMSQRKAYLDAFPSSRKWKDRTVDTRASELEKQSEILARIQELQKATEKNTILSSIERKEWLSKVILDNSQEMRDRLKACDTLNKMCGDYTEKIEVRVDEEKKKALENLSGMLEQMKEGVV